MTVRVGIVGAGNVRISHDAIVNAPPQAAVAAACDTSGYMLSVLEKQVGVATFGCYARMIDQEGIEAILVATPSSPHFPCAKYALERNLHLSVARPLTLSPAESRMLSELALKRRRLASASTSGSTSAPPSGGMPPERRALWPVIGSSCTGSRPSAFHAGLGVEGCLTHVGTEGCRNRIP